MISTRLKILQISYACNGSDVFCKYSDDERNIESFYSTRLSWYLVSLLNSISCTSLTYGLLGRDIVMCKLVMQRI